MGLVEWTVAGALVEIAALGTRSLVLADHDRELLLVRHTAIYSPPVASRACGVSDRV